MKPFYLVGGAQKPDGLHKAEWHSHEKGLVARIDPLTNTGSVCLEYVTPQEFLPDDDPNILFKAATFSDRSCFMCTSTEVLEYSFPDFRLLRRITHPCFNDVHHVHVADNGHLFVANTGLDMVVEMAPSGEILRMWNTLGDPNPWGRFSPEVDYRKVATTKPHQSHPNFVFTVDDQVWVTRFHQKDAVCLTEPDLRIPIDVQSPHDGLVVDRKVYFTTVDGHLIVADLDSLKVVAVHDLAAMHKGIRKVGWCRGLAVLDETLALVGFTRLRPTKWKANLNWLKNSTKDLRSFMHQPARVTLFDLQNQKILWEFHLDVLGMSTVFSIHPDPAETAETRAVA